MKTLSDSELDQVHSTGPLYAADKRIAIGRASMERAKRTEQHVRYFIAGMVFATVLIVFIGSIAS